MNACFVFGAICNKSLTMQQRTSDAKFALGVQHLAVLAFVPISDVTAVYDELVEVGIMDFANFLVLIILSSGSLLRP